MTFPRTHSQKMSGPEADIFFFYRCVGQEQWLYLVPAQEITPWVELLGLWLNGKIPISTLVVAQNIASALCLSVATALPITVSTSLF